MAIADQKNAINFLHSYFGTYIKEEIKEEGLVRKIEPFLRFLEVAGILNGQQVNSSNVSREAKIARATVDTYFSILEDTLIGNFLPAYRPNLKVQEQDHPKFYWFDSGVARAAAGLLGENLDDDWLGRSLETFIFHEIKYSKKWKGEYEQSMRSILENKKIKVKHAIGLYMGDIPLDRSEVQVLPIKDFIKRLNDGEFF